jgi:hypothetical protein
MEYAAADGAVAAALGVAEATRLDEAAFGLVAGVSVVVASAVGTEESGAAVVSVVSGASGVSVVAAPAATDRAEPDDRTTVAAPLLEFEVGALADGRVRAGPADPLARPEVAE